LAAVEDHESVEEPSIQTAFQKGVAHLVEELGLYGHEEGIVWAHSAYKDPIGEDNNFS
jgi:hypothetical protein